MFDANAYTITMLVAVVILAISFWLSRAGHYTANLIAIVIYWAVLMTGLFAFQTKEMRGMDYLWGENKLLALAFLAAIAFLVYDIFTRRANRGRN